MIRLKLMISIIILFLWGCTTPAVKSLKDAPTGATFTKDGNYIIGVNDVLKIQVIGGKASDDTYVVSQSGNMSIPLIGSTRAAGLTEGQLIRNLTVRFRKFIRDPTVSLAIIEYNSYKVYFYGEVRKPGVYNFTDRSSILQGLAVAGGLSNFANGTITLHRADSKGNVQLFRTTQDELIDGKLGFRNFILERGDLIQVD